MREIRLSGSGGGKGKRSLVQYWHATAPLLDLMSFHNGHSGVRPGTLIPLQTAPHQEHHSEKPLRFPENLEPRADDWHGCGRNGRRGRGGFCATAGLSSSAGLFLHFRLVVSFEFQVSSLTELLLQGVQFGAKRGGELRAE